MLRRMYRARHGLIERRLAWLIHERVDAEGLPVQIVSWNVHGICALLRRDHLRPFVAAYDPDVLRCAKAVSARDNHRGMSIS